MIQVYYPAAKGLGNPSAYFENINELGEQLAVTNGAPYIVTTHLGLTKTHSYQNAKPLQAKEKFPSFYSAMGWDYMVNKIHSS